MSSNGNLYHKYAEALAKVIVPLREFNINFIKYIRLYDDGSQMIMCSNANWLDYYFARQLHRYPMLGDYQYPEKISDQFSALLSVGLPQIPEITSALKLFNIGDYIVLVEKCEDHVRYVYFASHLKNNSINNFFVNNISLLKDFVLYLQRALATEIAECVATRVQVDRPIYHLHQNKITSASISSETKRQFFSKIALSGLCGQAGATIKFSKREYSCIKYLLQGYTAAGIAELLELSRRTIEHYIANIKQKLKCSTKTELIAKIRAMISADTIENM